MVTPNANRTLDPKCTMFKHQPAATANRRVRLRRTVLVGGCVVVSLYIVHVFAFSSCILRGLVPADEIPNDLVIVSKSAEESKDLPSCSLKPRGKPPPIPMYADSINERDFKTLDALGIELGGTGYPRQCRSQIRTAILVPYRGRPHHLHAFLWYMHQFLAMQSINYTIYIVEQSDKHGFNHGKLLNAGYKEVLALDPQHDCFIFQDMDTLPENLLNVYGCSHNPRHLVVSLNSLRYHLPYCDLVGGANALTREQFERVNGFANRFYGWGGEDDEFYDRVLANGYKVTRWDESVARYSMMIHRKETPNPNRHELLSNNEAYFKSDGLQSLHYRVLQRERRPLYTWFLIEL